MVKSTILPIFLYSCHTIFKSTLNIPEIKRKKKKKLYVSTYIDEKYQFFNHFIECKVLFYQIVDIVLNLAYIYLKEKKNIIDAFAGKIIIII